MNATAATSTTRGHRAGIFDIRNIIGALLAVDGLIILLVGLFADTSQEVEEKTGGVNANLWAGLALLVVGIAFLAWARLRPVVVPDDFEAERDKDGPPPGH
jgi:hypothetical protein